MARVHFCDVVSLGFFFLFADEFLFLLLFSYLEFFLSSDPPKLLLHFFYLCSLIAHRSKCKTERPPPAHSRELFQGKALVTGDIYRGKRRSFHELDMERLISWQQSWRICLENVADYSWLPIIVYSLALVSSREIALVHTFDSLYYGEGQMNWFFI